MIDMIGVVLGALPAGGWSSEPRIERTLRDPRIDESSGLVVSGRRSDLLWTSNDGPEGRLYAVGKDGRTAATYTIDGVTARDWEALAPGRDDGGQPAIYVGDIGDNSASRTRGILVHRVSEPPRLSTGSLPATSYRLRYPDGPHNAEALLVDPHSGRLYVVTKILFAGAVYAAPERLDPRGVNVLERVADAPGLVTDGAFLADGRVVLRGYGTAYVSADVRAEGTEFVLPEQPQGESIAALPDKADRDAVLTGSEGVGSAVWRVPLPGSSGESASAGHSPSSGNSTSTGPAGAAAAGNGARESTSVRWLSTWSRWVPWLPAGVLTGVLLLAGLRRQTRNRRRAE